MTTTTLDPTVRGHQPRGPKRWERARQWAEAHPESKLAKKYKLRTETARTVADAVGEKPWLHWQTGWSGGGDKFMGQTCSTYCAALTLQLHLSADGLDALTDATRVASERRAKGDPYVAFMEPRPEDSPRRGKCLTCGGTVTGGVATV